MDEAVTHYINSHPADEAQHVDANTLALSVQDDVGGRVAIMHSQSFSTSLCRQVSVGDQVVEGPWGEELIDPEGRLAALMAHLTAQQSRAPPLHHKVQTVRGDVDSSIILDGSMRLFHGQTLEYRNVPQDQSPESIVVGAQHLPPLPPLQDMKRCEDTDWYDSKAKTLKDDTSMVDSDGPVLELGAGGSPAHNKHQSKKSLPHKKRISRKLKKNNGNITPQQDIVVISCTDVDGRISCMDHGQEQEILPDSYGQQEHLPDETHHITHEVRPILICQLCGEFYGEEQLKFFQHLKQHYEPHIIIENPVPDLGIDKIANSCIVDNVATIPDSIVELSLENSIPKTIYQSIDKHVLYTTSDKTLTYANNKVQYSMASMDKEPTVVTDVEKTDLYDTLDKLDLYSCGKCSKSFRKQKQCEAHMKEAHSNMKLEDMGEFSEPEDLMEGIHVAVEEPAEHYEHTLLPHLTVENGHAHQSHQTHPSHQTHQPHQTHQDNVRHWYGRSAAGGGCLTYCGVCVAPRDREHPTQNLKVLKDEILRRILESDVSSVNTSFPDNMLPPDGGPLPPEPPHAPPGGEPGGEAGCESGGEVGCEVGGEVGCQPGGEAGEPVDGELDGEPVAVKTEAEGKKKQKRFECPQCGRVFQHRNSLLYHMLSHSGKQHQCRDCGKGFYTLAALKIHKRVHNGDRPYKCDVCGRDFRQWSDLKYHKVSIHSDQKMFKCEFCGKEFARKYSLNVHRRIHTGERNYKCEYCNKTFRASSYRLSHMRTHTGDRPHKCLQCDKCFRVAGDLRRHMLVHDKVRNRLNEQKIKSKDPKDIKKFHDIPEDSDKIKIEITPKTVKKMAVVANTKVSTILRTAEKKTPKGKKSQSLKKGAPNVTIDQLDDSYTNNVEVFDTRQEHYGKFKEETYAEGGYKEELEPFAKQAYGGPGAGGAGDAGGGRPMLAPGPRSRALNTDGRLPVYTLLERAPEPARPGDHENGFIERLTALYNIPAV